MMVQRQLPNPPQWRLRRTPEASRACSARCSLTLSQVSAAAVSGTYVHSSEYPLEITVILSYALQNSIQTSSILVVGRLGPDELSAAAFSLMLAMVTGEYSFSE